MSLLFMDSFDHYATADLTEKWTTSSGNLAIGAYGRNSTQGLRLSSSTGNAHASKTCLGGVNEVILGVAVTPLNPTSTQSTFIGFGTAGNWQCGLALLADLTVQPFVVTSASFVPGQNTGSYVTLLGSPSAVALQANVCAYIEVKMKCDGSTGTCTVRVNSIEVLALTGLDTSYDGTSLTRFYIAGGANGTMNFDYDDLVVMNTTGSFNNAFMGDVTISAKLPTGAGNSTGWTPSAGSNYQCVDEAQVNDDTDYVSSNVNTTKDLYAFGDAPPGADIRAVQLMIAARKGQEGPGQITPVVRSNSTDYDQTAQGIGGTTYTYIATLLETDPATAAAWTESGFNAAEFGAKKTA